MASAWRWVPRVSLHLILSASCATGRAAPISSSFAANAARLAAPFLFLLRRSCSARRAPLPHCPPPPLLGSLVPHRRLGLRAHPPLPRPPLWPKLELGARYSRPPPSISRRHRVRLSQSSIFPRIHATSYASTDPVHARRYTSPPRHRPHRGRPSPAAPPASTPHSPCSPPPCAAGAPYRRWRRMRKRRDAASRAAATEEGEEEEGRGELSSGGDEE